VAPVRKKSSAAWKIRHQRWRRFVDANIRAMKGGKGIRLGPSAPPLEAPAVKAGKGVPLKVVVCSPHPDDEALIGALALRLRRECGATVTNIAITLGSNASARARRRRELKSACAVLGFDLVVANPPGGFEHVHPDTRQNQPAEWAAKVRVLSAALELERPDAVFSPHAEDFNTTHIGTHYLVEDALGEYLERTGRGPLPLFETEFWHPNSRPNLMVGVSPDDEAILIMATAEHGGEVRRNPYHLRHPGRMIDNVRRGAEVVGGQGGPAPDFPFAELYRVVFMAGRNLVAPRPGGRVLGPTEKIDWQDLIASFRPEGLEGQG
jgi:LmbE family N-acetylglucosaminyl deacetylase